MLRRFRAIFCVVLTLRGLATGALMASSDQEIRVLDSASALSIRHPGGGEAASASATQSTTTPPSFSAMDARAQQLLEAQEVAKTAEYKVASECMRLENERTLAVVKQGLAAFQQEQRNRNRGPKFMQIADQVMSSVGHLVDLAQASGVFSGYADEVTSKDLAVATQAKALHLDEETSIIDGAIGRRLLSGTEGRRLLSGTEGGRRRRRKKGITGFWRRRRRPTRATGIVTVTQGTPSNPPTHASSNPPTHAPSNPPTHAPSNAPTRAPTGTPSYAPTPPTRAPTGTPSSAPTRAPTGTPSYVPTHAPTGTPSYAPSIVPTSIPTGIPSNAPSFFPTSTPTLSPTTNHVGSSGMNRCDYGLDPQTAPACGISAEEISVQRSYSFGGWHLAPLGATACDTGVSATVDECRSATDWIATESNKTQSPAEVYFQEATGSLGICTGKTHEQRIASMDSWGKVPLGCSVRPTVTAAPAPASGGSTGAPTDAPTDAGAAPRASGPAFGATYFKKDGTNCNDGFQLVCSGGVVKRKSPFGPPEYLGCYTVFSNGTRDLPDKKTPGTLAHCATQCSGYKYFGRVFDQCSCGNSFGSQGGATGCECDSNIVTIGNPMAPPIPKMNCVYKQVEGQVLPTRMPKVVTDPSMPRGCNLKLPSYKPLNHSYGAPCTNATLCGLCQGRCKQDSNCKGNLRCFHRLGNIEVPGCLKGGPEDVKDASFCALPGIPFVVPYTLPCNGFRIDQYQVSLFEAAIGLWTNGAVHEVIQSRKGKEVRRGKITLSMTDATGWAGKWSDAHAYESVSRPGETVGSSLTGSGSTEWSSLQDCIDVSISNGYVPGHSVRYVQNSGSRCYYYGAGSASGRSGTDTWLLNPVCLKDWLAGDVIRAGQSMTGPRVKGSNMAPPPGYVPKVGHFECANDPVAGTGALCCAGSPFNDPDPSSDYFFENGGKKTTENFCYELAEPDWLSQSLQNPIWNMEKWGRNFGTTELLCTGSQRTIAPSISPSRAPTLTPTLTPTYTPTVVPTFRPSFAPSDTPSGSPTVGPMFAPTVSPTSTELLPERIEKTRIKRKAMTERSIKDSAKHERTALQMLATEKHWKKEKFDKRTAELNRLALLQHKIASKLAYVDRLQTTCHSKDQSKEKTSKINFALVQVKLAPDVAAQSMLKVKIIHLIKASLTKLLGISKLNDAHGKYALELEAHRLVEVQTKLQKLLLQRSPDN